jgi:hypothetical protein
VLRTHIASYCATQRICHGLTNENTGKLLTERLETTLNDPLSTILSIPPSYVVNCFIRGDDKSQGAFRLFFYRTLSVQFCRIADDETLLTWINNILNELKTHDTGTWMGNLRLDWPTNEIEDVC